MLGVNNPKMTTPISWKMRVLSGLRLCYYRFKTHVFVLLLNKTMKPVIWIRAMLKLHMILQKKHSHNDVTWHFDHSLTIVTHNSFFIYNKSMNITYEQQL